MVIHELKSLYVVIMTNENQSHKDGYNERRSSNQRQYLN